MCLQEYEKLDTVVSGVTCCLLIFRILNFGHFFTTQRDGGFDWVATVLFLQHSLLPIIVFFLQAFFRLRQHVQDHIELNS